LWGTYPNGHWTGTTGVATQAFPTLIRSGWGRPGTTLSEEAHGSTSSAAGIRCSKIAAAPRALLHMLGWATLEWDSGAPVPSTRPRATIVLINADRDGRRGGARAIGVARFEVVVGHGLRWKENQFGRWADGARDPCRPPPSSVTPGTCHWTLLTANHSRALTPTSPIGRRRPSTCGETT
jgi:hypothetical protein